MTINAKNRTQPSAAPGPLLYYYCGTGYLGDAAQCMYLQLDTCRAGELCLLLW